MDFIVRLTSLHISNLKNVINGTIKMPASLKKESNNKCSEILGIYGQNGSGKTAVIDAVYFLHQIMTGNPVPDELYECINSDAEYALITAGFNITKDDAVYDTEYTIKFAKDGKKAVISEECIKYSALISGERKNKTVLINYERDNKRNILKPLKLLRKINAEDHESITNLIVARKISEKLNCSYIFNENVCEIFVGKYGNSCVEHMCIISALWQYAVKNLFVIRNTSSGLISANIMLPITFKLGGEDIGIKGDLLAPLKDCMVVEKNIKSLMDEMIFEINIVLKTIIPEMKIGIKSNGPQLTESGKEGENIELISLRNEKHPIPLRMESDGVIKIISILGALIHAFGNPSVLLAVDELDAGIFEYMLGELLDIFNKNGKGQLIFTSHNLRPLEMLDRDSIIFSTADPKERYVRIKNAKKSNNLRDMYLRIITLGGQNEVMYDETDSLKIARAFRKALRENNFD